MWNCCIIWWYVQYTKFLISLHSHGHLFAVLLIVAILMDVRWYIISILICSSLMISDTEHFFMSLLAICISSLEKYLFKPFALLKIRLSVFLFLYFQSPLYNNNLLSDIWFSNISPLCVLPFYFIESISDAPKFKTMKSNWSVFSFAFCVISKKSLPNLMLWSFCSVFYSESFIVLDITFMPLIHFELIFVYGVR